ncbi:MAG: penicillin-binding protein 2 [Chloroflexi bacterium]|nr:penicillin-binding protein 2 [Chloroflexota bacterium]
MIDRSERHFVHPRRLAAVALAIVGVFVVLSVRMWDLQVVNGSHYRELAEQNRVMRSPVLAARGVVYDRSGRLLARNDPGFAVSVIPVDVPRARQDELASRLAVLVGRGSDEILRAITDQRARNPYEPVQVSARPVGRETALLLVERAELYPGVRVTADAMRAYVDGPLYSPILGYVGPIDEEELAERKGGGYLLQDTIGKTGLEWQYERYLRGTLGWREIERDASLRELRTLALVPPKPGNDLVLTIDDRLQRLMNEELEKGVKEDKFSQAVGVAMNPQNGEILAMVSIPAYDNNAFVQGVSAAQMKAWNSDDRRPLVNKAIGDIYPPGSTFKMVTGLTALSTGVATRNTVVNVSSNVLVVDGWRFYDWRAHGPLNFVDGFAHSSDIYFYTLGGGNPYTGQRGAGPEAMAKYGRMLGFGAPTGIDLPGEARGIMPDPLWKLATFDEPWTLGNTYHAAIGQGFVAVTPLQLLNAYAAIANGGTVYKPHLLKEVRSGDGRTVHTEQASVARKLDVKQEDLRLIRESMRRVVTIGHAFMPDAKLPIAGKTGTAEFGESGGLDSAGRHKLGFHNWFVSFVPKADNADPTAEIAMVIFTFDSSRSVCDSCFNPAIALTQKILETYKGVRPAAGVP